MKAIIQKAYGSPEVLEVREIDRPGIGDHDVSVRVHAAGVHRGDWLVMRGLPYIARLGYGLLTPKNSVAGMEVAGKVEGIGKDVTRFQPGDEVFGWCSAKNVEMVRSIGADHVIDYAREDFADGERRYDMILDTACNRSLSHLRRALTPQGTLVLVGGSGGPWLMGTERTLRALMLSPFVRQRLRGFLSQPKKEDLAVLKTLIEAGKVTPVIDRTYPLSEVPDAMRYLEQQHPGGKLVITM